MIPDIGLIIGFYVITRMSAVLMRSGERVEPLPIKLLALVTIVVTIFCLIDLVFFAGKIIGK